MGEVEELSKTMKAMAVLLLPGRVCCRGTGTLFLAGFSSNEETTPFSELLGDP